MKTTENVAMWQRRIVTEGRPTLCNVFGAPGHQRPNFDGYIYLRYAAPSYSTRIRAHLSPSVW